MNQREKQEEELTKKCEEINKKFNALYCLSNDLYNFSIRLEKNTIAFCMKKNNEAIELKQQSTGFRKFFNLFFNFLHGDQIKKGDIVLIDEADIHLAVPDQKEFRNFLKEFGKKVVLLLL